MPELAWGVVICPELFSGCCCMAAGGRQWCAFPHTEGVSKEWQQIALPFWRWVYRAPSPCWFESLRVEYGLCSHVGCVITNWLDQPRMVLILFLFFLAGGDLFFKTCFPFDALISVVLSGCLYHCSSQSSVAKVAKQTNYNLKEILPCGVLTNWGKALFWRCIPNSICKA